ncbi:SDR family NAD(P)-dependent oxidoreductase [Streptomyces scopuliridis]|uniref:SDR family NAD(P)-dependent oxidoreductase n=1 Tax=Streptomyces scopuliridis TaxID=452529 RepID=UPI0036CFABCF
MNNKVAVVTRASRGIGRAVAERLGADGAWVIVNYHSNAVTAKDAVTAVERAGGRATAVRADVRDPAQLNSLFEAAVEEYGGLAVLVSNTGMARPISLADATDEDLELHFAINTLPVFRALKVASLRMRDGGRVVVISRRCDGRDASWRGPLRREQSGERATGPDGSTRARTARNHSEQRVARRYPHRCPASSDAS